MITGSPFKSSTNSFDNNNPIFLEVPPIQAQGDGDDLEDDGGRDDFAGFEGEDDNDNGEENEEDTGQFSFGSEDTEDQQTDEVEDTEDQESEGGNDDAEQDTGQFSFESEKTDQEANDDGGDQETEQQEQQPAVDTDDMTEQIQLHGAAGMNDAEQQGQQQAKQLGIGNDVAQQLGQATSQIGVDKDITQQNIGQEIEQQEAFSPSIKQKISQTATQITKSSEDQESQDSSDVQQVIKQIATQASTDNDDDVNQIVDQISKQITNSPKSDLAKSLGNLAGLYGSGNKDQVDQAIQQIGTQIAIGDNINQNTIQNIVQKAYQVTNNYFKNKIKVNIDDDDDNDDVKVIKKVYKRDNSCPTQSNSIQLKGKILGKGVIVLADFEPCELRDGRATLNVPTNPNLKFVVLSLDKKGNEHDGIIATKQKIQSLGKDSGLYVVNFDDEMIGNDPITGKKKTIDEINGLAIYNTATKSLNFNSGNSLALTAVLKK
ncbi:MAG TPA: hypothetical protein VEW92_05945 [Nitrososphaeraceae archaeon]|nr:hypothetical protein [Nitrososphaeraceae archaeon]